MTCIHIRDAGRVLPARPGYPLPTWNPARPGYYPATTRPARLLPGRPGPATCPATTRLLPGRPRRKLLPGKPRPRSSDHRASRIGSAPFVNSPPAVLCALYASSSRYLETRSQCTRGGEWHTWAAAAGGRPASAARPNPAVILGFRSPARLAGGRPASLICKDPV